MKKTRSTKRQYLTDDLSSEYRFDYSKGRRNPYSSRFSGDRVVVLIDEDLSKVFKTPGSVNKALREYLVVSTPKALRERARRVSSPK
jgi:hypothetical protein